MASKILIKRSTTASSVPTTSDLDTGELAVNTADKRVYTNNGGTIVELGTYPSTQAVVGNATVGGTFGVTGATTLSSGSVTGNWSVAGTLTVATPSNSTDATSKGYVDTADALKLNKAGDTMSGALAMGTNKITGLGTPTASTDAATKGYVDTAVANVVDAAPGALDTLNELAAAINDDASFATTITNSLATKLPLAGGTMTGNIVMGANAVTSTATPATADTLTRKGYVDTQDATKLNLSGGTMTGDITLGANKITSTATPATDDTLTRKGYVDSILGSATDAATSAAAAATSATNAANSASAASTSATNAASSASAASTSATNAASSATAASTSASSASSSATAAASSATSASTSAANAAASYDSFDDRYLGAKASAPALDNDGDALVVGALYFDTSTDTMKVYSSGGWTAAGSSVNGTANRYDYVVGTSSGSYTGSTTNFPATYDAGYVDVFLNGTKLVPTTDFTATSGTEIVLGTAASSGSNICIVGYGTFSLANFSVGDANDVDLSGISNGDALLYNSTSGNFEAGPVDALPSQSGNSGKYLTTDGSTASWGTVTTPTLASLGIDNHDDITVDASSNVGIGTGSPTAKLHVNGDILIPGNSQKIYGNGTSGSRSFIEMYNSSTGDMSLFTTYPTASVVFGTASTERMRIDSSGRVTMPYQPAFFVRSNGMSISHAVRAKVVLDVAITNIGSHFNTSTYRFTAPVAGMYHFNGNLLYRTSNNGRVILYLEVNGSGDRVSVQAYHAGSFNNDAGSGTISGDFYLNANDYVELDVYQDSGVTVSTLANEWVTFSGHLIG
jgi:hypothetical protein